MTPALRERRGREGSHNKMRREKNNVHKHNTALVVARFQLAYVGPSDNNTGIRVGQQHDIGSHNLSNGDRDGPP